MGFSVSQPAKHQKLLNMYQCPSGYIFRLRIPNDLKQIVGKCEFRYSLRTGSLRVKALWERHTIGQISSKNANA